MHLDCFHLAARDILIVVLKSRSAAILAAVVAASCPHFYLLYFQTDSPFHQERPRIKTKNATEFTIAFFSYSYAGLVIYRVR